jgi:hypothetical protein
MRDQFDTDLHDRDMLDEIGLCTSLIIAASESPRPLSQESIDRLLGRPRPTATG